MEVSFSGSEIEKGSSVDFLDEEEVQAVLRQENDEQLKLKICSPMFLFNKHSFY